MQKTIINIGILAHVEADKTTFTEQILAQVEKRVLRLNGDDADIREMLASTNEEMLRNLIGKNEIVFIDVNEQLVLELNNKGSYKVIVKDNNSSDKEILVRNVRAINARDVGLIIEEIATSDLIATSVGQGALKKIIPTISRGLIERQLRYPESAIDIIIAENIRNGAEFFKKELSSNLPEEFPLDQFIGLIETSIGKMVPIMGAKEIEEDLLWVFSEPYNQLILDRKNLKNPLPLIDSINQVDDIKAYVDRKLFIHNLGHAAAAYFGYLKYPSRQYMYQVLDDKEIVTKVEACMNEAASALCREYPLAFTIEDLQDHIQDLITRFQNKALGDTVFRVGRDLSRKLEKNDRILGAILLCQKHNLQSDNILMAAAAGFYFKAQDENNNIFPGDKNFFHQLDSDGIKNVLVDICHLDKHNEFDAKIIENISFHYNKLKKNG